MTRALLSAAAAAAVLLSGCGSTETGSVTVSAVGAPLRIVNPNRERLDAASAILLESTAQGLVRLDAGGEIEPALAQRWIVSDDGLRYTFRLGRAQWHGGARVTAEEVVARLQAAASPRSANPLRPILGSIEEIVAMTDDVLEISLRSPRPNFLQVLAQPEMAILKAGRGSGPFQARTQAGGGWLLSLPRRRNEDEEAETAAERVPAVELRGEAAGMGVARFATGGADLVTGGTLSDLPLARAARTPRGTLRFDPATGLLGLAFTGGEGPFASAEVRQAVAMVLDRPALVARMGVPGLQMRQTLLPPGIEGLTSVSAPAWIRQPLPARRAMAAAIVRRAAEGGQAIVLRLEMPPGIGWDAPFAQLRRDWAAAGLRAVRVRPGEPADLRLIDEVAPAALASWYLRRFSCEASRICDPAADERMAAARLAPDAAARRAALADADRILAGLGSFIPLTAPVRWSLVAPRLTGFRPNMFGRHPVGELVRPQA